MLPGRVAPIFHCCLLGYVGGFQVKVVLGKAVSCPFLIDAAFCRDPDGAETNPKEFCVQFFKSNPLALPAFSDDFYFF